MEEPLSAQEPLHRATKRSFPEEIGGYVQNGSLMDGQGLPSKMSLPPFEEAFVEANAEDIQEDDADSFVDVEEVSSEDRPFVGRLPFDFKCCRCPTQFHVFEALRSHVEANHALYQHYKMLSCHLCRKGYETTNRFWLHMKIKHGIEPLPDHPAGYLCDECGGHFRRREEYALHCQFYRGLPHLFCDLCQEAVYSNRKEEHAKTIKHLAIDAGEAPTLSKFGAVASDDVTGEDLEEEEQTPPTLEELGSKPFVGTLPFTFRCPLCRVGFHVFAPLQCHMRKHHPGEFPLWCNWCPVKYQQIGHFWNHLRGVHGLVPPRNDKAGYECDECGQDFRLREDYASHCQYFRGRPHFFCRHCRKMAFERDSHRHLHQQLRDLTNAAKFCCQECGKRCGGKKEHKKHQESLSEKPHAFCLQCATILEADGWEDHQEMMGHEGLQLHFHCCQLVFRPEEWENHQKLDCHVENFKSTTARYKCHVEGCGRPFQLARQLKTHMALHPGQKPFPCPYCPLQFRVRLELKHHQREKHWVPVITIA